MGRRAGPRSLPCPEPQAVANVCQQISKAIAKRYKEFGPQQLNQPMTRSIPSLWQRHFIACLT